MVSSTIYDYKKTKIFIPHRNLASVWFIFDNVWVCIWIYISRSNVINNQIVLTRESHHEIINYVYEVTHLPRNGCLLEKCSSVLKKRQKGKKQTATISECVDWKQTVIGSRLHIFIVDVWSHCVHYVTPHYTIHILEQKSNNGKTCVLYVLQNRTCGQYVHYYSHNCINFGYSSKSHSMAVRLSCH